MTGFSLTAPQFARTVAPLLGWASFLEEAHFDGGFLFDHLVPIGDASRPVLEMAGALGLLSSVTSTIDIGTLVMRATLRGPEISAGVSAAASAIAPGRLIVGLGAGDRLSAAEAERFGMAQGSLDQRVASLRRTAEAVAAAVPDIRVWVGGTHARVIDVAATSAVGWNGWMVEPDRFAEIKGMLPSTHRATWGGAVVVGSTHDEVQRLVEERGGAEGVLTGTIDQVAGRLRDYVRAGADHLILSMLPNRIDRWELAPLLRERLG